MKKLTLILALILAITTAMAQDDYNGVRTIFSNGANNGGFGAISLGYSQIDNSDAFVGGVRGGFIFAHNFSIGLGGYGFVNNLDNNNYQSSFANEDLYLAGGYGGLIIEPIAGGILPVHVSFPMLFGIGGVALSSDNWDWDDEYHNSDYDNDVFFVFEPGIELEFNLARFFRLATTITYRITSDIDLTYAGSPFVNPDALRGLHFGMVFKFGSF